MHTLLALILTAAASAVIARPPGPVSPTPSKEEPLHSPTRKYLKEYVLPRFVWPHYFSFEDPIEVLQTHRQPMATNEWLNQEIDRLSHMKLPYHPDSPRRLLRSPYYKRWPIPYPMQSHIQPYYGSQPWPAQNLVLDDMLQKNRQYDEKKQKSVENGPRNEETKKEQFALTPRDPGYFEPEPVKQSEYIAPVNRTSAVVDPEAGRAAPRPELAPVPPRRTRQNPNLSRTKTLVSENLAILRNGLGHEDMGQDNSRHISHMESSESPGTFYGVALLAAVGAAAVLAILGFAFGWYTLSKRAKAAADVDYPAYGVTGPSIDKSGDRRLAHSAHMYHYQHQKQQILAMERSGLDTHSNSISDPESEEENEEGDYTVYECPGFASTGDMEVKNPLFNEDPTPATPGKCEVMKPQPKD